MAKPDRLPPELRPLDASAAAVLHDLTCDVVRAGGAIGWPQAPSRAEFDAWLRGVVADIDVGDAYGALAFRGSELAGVGYWRRYGRPTLRRNADVEKIYVAPTAQGAGVGRALTDHLVATAQSADVETLTLDARGDNETALRLYREVGFTEYGRLPGFVAFGEKRYDQVLMSLDLRVR